MNYGQKYNAVNFCIKSKSINHDYYYTHLDTYITLPRKQNRVSHRRNLIIDPEHKFDSVR